MTPDSPDAPDCPDQPDAPDAPEHGAPRADRIDDAAWRLVTRAVSGQLTDADRCAFEDQLHRDPAVRQVHEELRVAWTHAGTPAQAWDARAALARITHARRLHARPAEIVPTRPQHWPAAARRARWPQFLAAAVIVAALGTLVWRDTRRTPAHPAPVALTELRAEPRERATLTLGDGTRIVLAPGSVLRYPSDRDTPTRRDVQLDGEAYFDVARDAARPFVVRTAHAVVRDVGTQFVVRAFAEHARVEVIVAEGAVALQAAGRHSLTNASDSSAPSDMRDTGRATILGPADRGRIDAAGRVSVTHNVDVGPELAWMRGQLAFANAPLRDVLPRFNRWFDVDVRLGDSALAATRFTAAFADESSAQAVQVLAAVLALRVVHAGHTLILYPARPATPDARPPE